jgi:hypothetical protein
MCIHLESNKSLFFYYLKKILNCYYLIQFLLFREQYFNFIFNFNKKKKKLKVQKLKKITTIKSYIPLKKKNSFLFNNHYYLYTVFFFSFKKMVFEKIINNSFSYYKNKVIIYNLKNDFIFFKTKYYQFDYYIKNFLEEEVSSLIN